MIGERRGGGEEGTVGLRARGHLPYGSSAHGVIEMISPAVIIYAIVGV